MVKSLFGAALLLACLVPAQVQGGSVLLMRHCPRAPYADERHPPLPPNNFTFADNFTSRHFPSYSEWGAKQGACTPQGLKLARDIGVLLPSVLGLARGRVVSDSVGRCKDTAIALGLNSTAVELDQALFDPLSAKVPGCSQPDWQGVLEEQVAKAGPALQKARAQLPMLQALLGKGVAPSLEQIPDNISDGYFVGGLRTASESIVETFQLERTSSMPTAWGQLSASGLTELTQLRSTYFSTMYGGRGIAQRYASGILATLLKPSPSTTVLLGHDLNLEGVRSLLGLEWQCGPWPANALPPLAGVHFNLVGDSVHVQVVCPSLNETSPLAVGAATFADGKSEMPEPEFSSLAKSAVEWPCTNSSLSEASPIIVV